MSDFNFDCPKCGQSIVCDTSNAGMNIPCPACNAPISIPKPPPPPPAEPGKLSISKSQAHHHPPAGPSQPAATTWGAKPTAPPPKRKPKWMKPLVTSVVLIVILAAGWLFVGKPMLDERAKKAQEAKDEADRQAAEKAKADAEAAEKAKRERASYSLDLANVDFPQRPASGRIHGVNFKAETSFFSRGILVLKQDAEPVSQYIVYLQFKPGEGPAGKSFNVTSDETNRTVQVAMTWKDDTGKPAVARFPKGYAMKLEFDPADGANLHGRIFLCMPDVEQSFVAGDFQCVPPGAAPAGGPAPAQPPPPKRVKRQE
jgi:hypothetical protein